MPLLHAISHSHNPENGRQWGAAGLTENLPQGRPPPCRAAAFFAHHAVQVGHESPNNMYENHAFHIPVMGTGFSADLPLKVGRYGVNSVISLVDDRLLGQLREYLSREHQVEYNEIGLREPNGRALRITAYLDFMQDQLDRQIEAMRAETFSPGTELTRYFELLGPGELRESYLSMMALPEGEQKTIEQDRLRHRVVPGSIDANIMTKIDRKYDAKGELRASEDSDALSALRGFANSKVRGSIVYSAGLNARLYGYTARFDCFYLDANGKFPKQVVLKVSDYRSAAIQGKFFANRGIWVSEYRIEAGLNCGGHAFPADGQLIGVILDTFKQKRDELQASLFKVWTKTLRQEGRPIPDQAPELRVTVQGGIGTSAEREFITERFGVDATGWASPFLLVPEAVTLDAETRARLQSATRDEIQLSWSSPLQVRYWNLINSTSEDSRRSRLQSERPGSACPKGFLADDRNYTAAPLCLASRAYQKQYLVSLRSVEVCAEEKKPAVQERALAKSCICHELGNGILVALGIDEKAAVSVCPGPNLANFKQLATLEQMFGHIYGRHDLLDGVERPHAFVTELQLNIDYLRDEIADFNRGLTDRKPIFFSKTRKNLLAGIVFYRNLADEMGEQGPLFLRQIEAAASTMDNLPSMGSDE